MRPVSLKVRALRWLARREHSPHELRAKLLHATITHAADEPDGRASADAAAEVDALIAWLEANGYLSAQRFVDSRVHARQGRYGNRRIEQELRQHAVVPDATTQQALRETELERARALWRRKFGVAAVDAAGRARQMRFLVGRGFSPAVVRQLVRPAEDGEPA